MGRISSRLRFEILKRDGFKCTYCGASGGDVELQVDHRHPRCEGGTDARENLVTACFTCNIGKGGIPLDKQAKTKKPHYPASQPGLVGKCFLTLGADGKAEKQGIVRAKITELQYLVQYFDWIIGEPSTMSIVGLHRMVCDVSNDRGPNSWIFFEDDEHLRYWCNGFGKKYMHSDEWKPTPKVSPVTPDEYDEPVRVSDRQPADLSDEF